jgi:hypothetical protein
LGKAPQARVFYIDTFICEECGGNVEEITSIGDLENKG